MWWLHRDCFVFSWFLVSVMLFKSTSATGVDVSMDKCRPHGGASVSWPFSRSVDAVLTWSQLCRPHGDDLFQWRVPQECERRGEGQQFVRWWHGLQGASERHRARAPSATPGGWDNSWQLLLVSWCLRLCSGYSGLISFVIIPSIIYFVVLFF